MIRLPTLEKNAFLSIYITPDGIDANLAYSHYDISRSYILNDFLFIHRDHNLEDIYSTDFWESYFKTLSKTFNWELFTQTSHIKQLEGEGDGVTGIKVSFSERGLDRSKLINAVRGYSNEINLSIYDTKTRNETLQGIAKKNSYDDAILLELNLRDFSIYRTKEGKKKKKLVDYSLDTNEVVDGKIRWRDIMRLIDSISGSKFKAFLSVDGHQKRMVNAWGNFVNSPTKTTTSELLKDIIRGYITVQLLTVLNDNPKKFNDIGVKGKTLLWVTGDLVELIPKQMLLIALIDGLELMGELDVVVDLDNHIYTYGKSYVDGVNASDYILNTRDLLGDVTKLYVPEITGKKGMKVLFTANTVGEKYKREDYFILSSNLSSIDLSKFKSKVIFEGEFQKGAYLTDIGENIEFITNPDGFNITSVFVDGRRKPVIYGPDPRANRLKFTDWFDEKN